MSDDTTIPFQLDEGTDQEGVNLVYRPWSTRTLKLKLTTASDLPALLLRPGRILPEETEAGIFRNYADDSDAFIISWGGGHEEGPPVKAKDFLMAFEKPAPLPAGESSNLYFNLTHVGPDLPEAVTVTVAAYNPKNDQVVASLPVTLKKPAGLPESGEIIQLLSDGDGRWTASAGAKLPKYDSRWWPAPAVDYLAADPLPLSIVREDNQLNIIWGEDDKTVATVTDNTSPSVLLNPEASAFELFAFDEYSIVLRVWFFWLDTNIGGGFFIGRHEVPDAERFDMIMRRSDGRVLMVGTDMHWRELWSEVAQHPLRAAIGVGRDDKANVAKDMLGTVWSKLTKKEKEKDDYVNNPMDDYVARMAYRLATETDRKKGTEAHVPMLYGVEQLRPERMTSTDVRRG